MWIVAAAALVGCGDGVPVWLAAIESEGVQPDAGGGDGDGDRALDEGEPGDGDDGAGGDGDGDGDGAGDGDGDGVGDGDGDGDAGLGPCGGCPTPQRCDSVSGRCVDCLANDDCTDSLCEPRSQTCVACLVDLDCGGQHCDPVSFQCEECVEDRHCGTQRCDPAAKTCVECLEDGDCSNGVCDPTVGACVECTADAHCPGEACDTDANTCVRCVDDTHCSPGAPVCNPGTNLCVGCVSDADCDGPTPYCEPTASECVGCFDSELHCTVPDTVCDPTDQICVRDPRCGDGIKDPGELCDDGNEEDDDLCNAGCDGIDLLCTVDHTDSVPDEARGSSPIPPSDAIVGLCGGHVIGTSEDQLGVAAYDVRHGSELVWSYALGARPTALALDRAAGHLYVGVEGMNAIAWIDLGDESGGWIATPSEVSELVVGNDGWLFARSESDAGLAIDTVLGATQLTLIGGGGDHLAYDRVHDRLYTFGGAVDNAQAEVFAWTADPPTATSLATFAGGEDANAVAVSPDGESVLFVAADGNDGERWGRSVFHYSTESTTRVLGDFSRHDALWRDAAFSPDSATVALASSLHPELFDVETHEHLGTVPGDTCIGNQQLAWSPGGSYLYQASRWCSPVRTDVIWGAIERAAPTPLPAGSCGNGILEQGEVCDDGNVLGSDLCSSDCNTLDPLCSLDRDGPATGADASIEMVSELVPLCDGWVLAGMLHDARVELRNVVTGTVMRTYRLGNRPRQLALDPGTGHLWAAIGPAPRIERVDLTTGAVTGFDVPGSAWLVEPVPGGSSVFAVTHADLFSPSRELHVLDAAGAVQSTTASDIDELAYGPLQDRLYALAGDLHRYGFDEGTRALSHQDSMGASMLALSPDETQLIYSCTWISGDSHLVAREPTNFSSTIETYMPGCAELPAFSPDGAQLVVTPSIGDQLLVTAAVPGSSVSSTGYSDNVCNQHPSKRQLAYSRGGNYVYLVQHCVGGPEPLVYVRLP